MTREVFICATARTPIGRYGGSLAKVRTDDLAAVPIRALVERHPGRRRSRRRGRPRLRQPGRRGQPQRRPHGAAAGRPAGDRAGHHHQPALRLRPRRGRHAARAIKAGEIDLAIAGGVESMSRAPLVMGKAEAAFQRAAEIHDTTIGWRFINPLMKAQYGVDSMPETGENVAEEFQVSRADQDAFALRSQQRAKTARWRPAPSTDRWCRSRCRGRRAPTIVDRDEHPRPDTTLEALARLKPIVRDGGTVTAGNASGVNDGAAALIVASAEAAERCGLTPLVRVLGMATAGVPPRIMGIGPVPATRKLLDRLGLKIARSRLDRTQ